MLFACAGCPTIPTLRKEKPKEPSGRRLDCGRLRGRSSLLTSVGGPPLTTQQPQSPIRSKTRTKSNKGTFYFSAWQSVTQLNSNVELRFLMRVRVCWVCTKTDGQQKGDAAQFAKLSCVPIVFGTLIAVSSDLPCFECLWRWNVVRAKVVRGVIGKGAKTGAASGPADNTTESPCEIRPVFSGDSGGGAVLRRRLCRRSTSRSFREFAASAYGPSRD